MLLIESFVLRKDQGSYSGVTQANSVNIKKTFTLSTDSSDRLGTKVELLRDRSRS